LLYGKKIKSGYQKQEISFSKDQETPCDQVCKKSRNQGENRQKEKEIDFEHLRNPLLAGFLGSLIMEVWVDVLKIGLIFDKL
jgi:hypothetical protein